jgi:hypothetical protein
MVIFYPDINEVFKNKYPYPIAMGMYDHEEYLRVVSLSEKWYKIHIFIGVTLILCFIGLFTTLLYFLYIGFCSLLPLDGSWYFQYYILFAVPATILAIPSGPLASYSIIRLLQPKDYEKIIDLMNVKSKYDGISAFRWVLKGCMWVVVLLLPFIGWSYMAVKKDGITVKYVFSTKTKHYDYSDIGQAFHYKRSNDPEKGVYLHDHYDIILKNGMHIWQLAPVSDNPEAYEKKIIEMGRLTVTETDLDK